MVDVLADVAALDGEAVAAAGGELLAVGDELLPGGRRAVDPGLGEELLVPVQAVGHRVERDGGRVLAGGAGRGEGGGQEALLAAGLREGGGVEGPQGAGGLERGGPGVADVEHVGALAGSGGGEDPVQQVRPGDDLQFHLDAGLLLELPQLGFQHLAVVLQAGALVGGPVGEGAGAAVAPASGCGAPAAGGGGEDERGGQHAGGGGADDGHGGIPSSGEVRCCDT